jgi:hypothetical protein
MYVLACTCIIAAPMSPLQLEAYKKKILSAMMMSKSHKARGGSSSSAKQEEDWTRDDFPWSAELLHTMNEIFSIESFR